MAQVLKFREIAVGQIIGNINQEKYHDCFLKVPETKFKEGICSNCKGGAWNALNINALGCFHVHFCPQIEVIFNPYSPSTFDAIAASMKPDLFNAKPGELKTPYADKFNEFEIALQNLLITCNRQIADSKPITHEEIKQEFEAARRKVLNVFNNVLTELQLKNKRS